MLPTVEMAYIRPETRPALAVSSMARRIANGETVPSSVTGTANRISVTANDPAIAAALTLSTARAASCKTGRATTGTSPAVNAPHRMSR